MGPIDFITSMKSLTDSCKRHLHAAPVWTRLRPSPDYRTLLSGHTDIPKQTSSRFILDLDYTLLVDSSGLEEHQMMEIRASSQRIAIDLVRSKASAVGSVASDKGDSFL